MQRPFATPPLFSPSRTQSLQWLTIIIQILSHFRSGWSPKYDIYCRLTSTPVNILSPIVWCTIIRGFAGNHAAIPAPDIFITISMLQCQPIN